MQLVHWRESAIVRIAFSSELSGRVDQGHHATLRSSAKDPTNIAFELWEIPPDGGSSFDFYIHLDDDVTRLPSPFVSCVELAPHPPPPSPPPPPPSPLPSPPAPLAAAAAAEAAAAPAATAARDLVRRLRDAAEREQGVGARGQRRSESSAGLGGAQGS